MEMSSLRLVSHRRTLSCSPWEQASTVTSFGVVIKRIQLGSEGDSAELNRVSTEVQYPGEYIGCAGSVTSTPKLVASTASTTYRLGITNTGLTSVSLRGSWINKEDVWPGDAVAFGHSKVRRIESTNKALPNGTCRPHLQPSRPLISLGWTNVVAANPAVEGLKRV